MIIFILMYIFLSKKGYTSEVLTEEIKYTLSKIIIAPANESPWNYLRGLLITSQKSNKRQPVMHPQEH
jgi:hypothetical protein